MTLGILAKFKKLSKVPFSIILAFSIWDKMKVLVELKAATSAKLTIQKV